MIYGQFWLSWGPANDQSPHIHAYYCRLWYRSNKYIKRDIDGNWLSKLGTFHIDIAWQPHMRAVENVMPVTKMTWKVVIKSCHHSNFKALTQLFSRWCTQCVFCSQGGGLGLQEKQRRRNTPGDGEILATELYTK